MALQLDQLSVSDDTTKTLISAGSPKIYQLNAKREKFENFIKITSGIKNKLNPNKTILLVGETGTGKSTLLNALFNYTVGVKFEDDVWYQIVKDENRSQTESQTSDVIVYQIFGFEGKTLPCSLTIIDTPGYGDTRGIEQDKNVSQKLYELFKSKDGVCEVNAVGLVVKASTNRLSDRLKYIFNSVTSLFGKDVQSNIVALITHSDGRKPKDALKALESANIKSSTNDLSYFLFNNCQHEDRTEDRDILERDNQISLKGFNELIQFMDKTKPQTLIKTVEVMDKRIRLTACIQNLKDRIQLIELSQNEIKQTKEALKKHEDEMKKNKNFTIVVDEHYKEKETISGGMWGMVFYEGAVTCKICEENCHYPGCTMTWSPKGCVVMNLWDRCTVCTRKCPESAHVKEEWIYVTKTRKVQKTLYDLKSKYEQNKAECGTKKSLLETLEEKYNKLTTEWSMLLDEAYSHVIKLEQIALNANSVSTMVHLDFLIKKMEGKGDQKKANKLKEMKNQLDEGTKAAINYGRK